MNFDFWGISINVPDLNINSVNVIFSFIIFVTLEFLYLIVPQWGHKKYKQFLLWVQTYTLRKGYTPFNLFEQINALKQRFTSTHLQHKGLVGVLTVNIPKIATSTIAVNNHIHFINENEDYDKREPKTPKELKEEVEKITTHYKSLANEIKNDYKDNPLFKFGDTDITTKFIEIYSFDNIEKYVRKVSDEIRDNNAIHFIGDKIGIEGYSLTNDELKLAIYKTDHFTWQVFKEIFKENKPFFQEIILRVNRSSQAEKNILLKCLKFLFSSFGIDIIVESKNCQGKRNIIITARSGSIEKSKESSLHVSVNETFSRTDNIGHSEQSYCVYKCVKRGIQEELGIFEEEIDDSLITFHDFAIVTDEGEIGFSCHVNFSNNIPTEKILMYPGQDKFIENEEILVLPYFKINHLSLIKSVNSTKYMRNFIICTQNDRFNMPWMSFTPLLISRIMIRNIELNKFFTPIIYWSSCSLLISYISPIFSLAIANCLTTIFSALGLLFLTSSWQRIKLHINKKYKFIRPFVSQWHGNAKVIQATGSLDSNTPSEGLTFKIEKSPHYPMPHKTLKLSDLELINSPLCYVRIKKNDNSYAEKPISTYNFQIKGIGTNQPIGVLHFNSLMISSNNGSTSLKIRFDYKTDPISNRKKIKAISFSSKITDDIQFDINEDDKKKNTITKTLNENNKFKPNDLLIYDLFFYKGDYYWSCTCSKDENMDIKYTFLIDKKKSNTTEIVDFYKYIENIINNDENMLEEGTITIRIKGQNSMIEHWLNNFVKHPNNKRRISELDIYMLQLYFIRKDILFAECEYTQRPKYKVFLKS